MVRTCQDKQIHLALRGLLQAATRLRETDPSIVTDLQRFAEASKIFKVDSLHHRSDLSHRAKAAFDEMLSIKSRLLDAGLSLPLLLHAEKHPDELDFELKHHRPLLTA